jgi:peptidoglycan/LPS O-acetylase OafA/YrhL
MVVAGLSVISTIVLTMLLHNLVEKPFARMKKRIV